MLPTKHLKSKFYNRNYKTFHIFRGFEQLCSSSGWREMGKYVAGTIVPCVGLKGRDFWHSLEKWIFSWNARNKLIYSRVKRVSFATANIIKRLATFSWLAFKSNFLPYYFERESFLIKRKEQTWAVDPRLFWNRVGRLNDVEARCLIYGNKCLRWSSSVPWCSENLCHVRKGEGCRARFKTLIGWDSENCFAVSWFEDLWLDSSKSNFAPEIVSHQFVDFCTNLCCHRIRQLIPFVKTFGGTELEDGVK